MNPIADILHQLVELSRKITEKLEESDPSLDEIEEMLEERKRFIEKLDPLTDNIDANAFSEEEQQHLASRFRQFRDFHVRIQPMLEQLMNTQEELLGEASKKRKAEDRYHFLEKPDISYFTE